MVVRPSVAPPPVRARAARVRYVARRRRRTGDGTSRKRRVSGGGAGGEDCGGRIDEREEGGRGALSGHGAVAAVAAEEEEEERSVCVFTKRNLQLLPSFLPPSIPANCRCRATALRAARDGGGRSDGGGRKTEGAGGRAKKEGATSPLPSCLIHPISHTFLSHLAEYAAEDCHLSVRPSASCPCVRPQSVPSWVELN